MAQLYPLLMQPAFDPRPWGTLDLSAIYPNHKFNERIGEAWLTGDNCVVANGPLAKRSLADLSKEFGAELVGTAARDPQRFPLLLKFLFPEEKLSVQVHPDDATAQRFGEPWGKTECWYVAHAKPGSQIALGLKPGVTVAQFEQSIQERSRGKVAQLDQRLSGRNDLRGRRHGAYAGEAQSSSKRSSSPTPRIVSTTTDARARCIWSAASPRSRSAPPPAK
jgi:mannose-6-phosphate isomerase class I